MQATTVVVTRPEPQNSALSSLLSAAGLQVISLPAFQFEPLLAEVNFNMLWKSQRRRLAIFCSPRSVQFGLRQLPAGFLHEVEVAAIGPATAEALEQAGVQASIVPETGYASEDLLNHPKLSERPGEAVIFAAPGGRQRLYQELLNRQWQVQFAHVYRAVLLQPDAQTEKCLQAADKLVSVWTSARALQHLSTSLDPVTWQQVCSGRFLVISQRLAELAQAFAPGRVTISKGPDNKAIVAAVLAGAKS